MTANPDYGEAFEHERTRQLVAGTVVLVILALLAKLAHTLVPQVPGLVWALGFGVLAGTGSSGARRRLPALPYYLPLTVGLILMGAQIDPNILAVVGWQGFVAVGALWLGMTFAFWAIARVGLLPSRLAGLFTLGLIGCGVSAIVGAAQEDRKAEGTPAVYATLAVLVSGGIGLIVFPFIGDALGMDASEFGTFAGIAIANSAEAVAAAAVHSDAALGTAAAFKLLVNALQGVPILIYLLIFTPRIKHARGWQVPKALVSRVPYFVWGFAAVAVAAGLGAFDPSERESLGKLTRLAFFIALVGVGFKTRLDVIRRIGFRPILIGVVVWAAASAAVLIWLKS